MSKPYSGLASFADVWNQHAQNVADYKDFLMLTQTTRDWIITNFKGVGETDAQAYLKAIKCTFGLTVLKFINVSNLLFDSDVQSFANQIGL